MRFILYFILLFIFSGSPDEQLFSGKLLSQIKAQLESSVSRKLIDVKNTQEKERMDMMNRFERIEKLISQNQQTTELMQASHKHVMDEGLQRTRGNLQNLSEKFDDMEHLIETRIQEMRVPGEGAGSEKIQDLTHEVKDLRRDFGKFQNETSEKLNTLSRDMTHVKESMVSFQETLLEMKESLSNLPQYSTPYQSLPLYHSTSHPSLIQPLHLPDSKEFSGPRVQPSSESQHKPLKSASSSSSTDGCTKTCVHPIREPPSPIKLSGFKQSIPQEQQELPFDSDIHSRSLDQESRNALDEVFKEAESKGLFDSDEEHQSEHSYTSVPFNQHVMESSSLSLPGATGLPDESWNDSGTMPISKSVSLSLPSDVHVHADVEEDSIVSIAQREMQIGLCRSR